MSNETNIPDYLFEVSWEVCNKVGGIHTVISTKATTLAKQFKGNHIFIGPDIVHHATEYPEFIEDVKLFKSWREKSAANGLRFRVGRWNIKSKPIAVLVDFSSYISQKDYILRVFWDEYKLDSISGSWEYIEPALFGYAAGKVIESYTSYFLSRSHKIVAHFHEWMTGCGLLYLKTNAKQIATLFTTHATVLGRSIAGNNLPLYDQIDSFNPEMKAHEYKVVAKHSLEKVSAINADCFTTVSQITASECKAFLSKEVDIITPNGFDDTIVPSDDEYKMQKIEARVKFHEVAEALLGYSVSYDSIFLGTGGRYEFKNKGIDVLLKSLAKLNSSKTLTKDILAFIMVPAGHHGSRKDVFHNLMDNDNIIQLSNNHISHYLLNIDNDPILNMARSLGINNKEQDRVKMFFIPCYLDGYDRIFDKTYYQMLVGLDITLFPSYYEPWGYTPLESLAFKVPTLTTTLAGFGLWVKDKCIQDHPGIEVIERTDFNEEEVVKLISEKILSFSEFDSNRKQEICNNAFDVSKIALWDNLINYYYNAFDIALTKVSGRIDKLIYQDREELLLKPSVDIAISKPNWTRLLVKKNIPKKLQALDLLSRNYWWSWNHDAIDLFESIDSELWREIGYNAFLFLEKISLRRYLKLSKDEEFLSKLKAVFDRFNNYMKLKSEQTEPKIAYFSMEFGIHTSLKIYSGGLGILAGDYLKEASDKNIDIIGVGLLYRFGYFMQQISSIGQQIPIYQSQDFSKIPVNAVKDKDGNILKVVIVLPGRNVYIRVWLVNVGRNYLYLLDTDLDENIPEDRIITSQLYGGDSENRLKQELVLGIGGIRALRAMGINPDIYHCNEGHAAFTGVERLTNLIKEDALSFDEALEVVRSSSLFTTHTPVPAGHDTFQESLLRTYISHYSHRLKISWEQFMKLGRLNPNNLSEKFSMSFLATNLSQEMNGVSMLHGDVTKQMFKDMWPGYYPNELHIGYVTNGVHFSTWVSKEWKEFCMEELGENFQRNSNNCGRRILNISDNKIWNVRKIQKNNLIAYIKKRLLEPETVKFDNPKQIIEIRNSLKENVLTIGFARRFATYKRAYLLFTDLKRLSKIVNNPSRPVLFIFAGKAHPNDTEGQTLIRRIVELSKTPEFIGKVIFLQNYDMELASHMVQGVDVWLNNPVRPMEASGTSGMKAVVNGVLHFSVLDGWWVEGYKPDAGWALPQEQTYSDNEFQDALDVETMYSIIENDIIPSYYQTNRSNIPEKWVGYIKNSMAQVAPNFTSSRMLYDYENKFYNKLFVRGKQIKEDDFKLAKDIVAWKKYVSSNWNDIEIVSVNQVDTSKEPIVIGEKYKIEVVLKLNRIVSNDVGVELVVAESIEDNNVVVKYTQEFNNIKSEGNIVTYSLDIIPEEPGVFDIGIRIYAKNLNLPHRQDFCLVKWI